MKRLAVCALLVLAFNAVTFTASAASRSITFGKFADSGEQDFIRRYVAETPYHQEAASYMPIDVEYIGVAKIDLNDDGVDELILNFDLSTYYCGTVGCDAFLFRKMNGAWQPIGEYKGLMAAMSDEKDRGWRRIEIRDGDGDSELKWDGQTYR
jgi:hypothetical protein